MFILNDELIKDYIINNDQTIKASDFDYNVTRTFPGVYEVIRIIDSVPLFFEKHASRFRSSARLLGFELSLKDECLKTYIDELIRINDCSFGNVKIVINNLGRSDEQCYVFFVRSKYPEKSEIENGVHVILYYGERNNPKAKTTDLALRDKINLEIANHGAYEALLVNKHGEITEGSKSNLFFVKGEDVYTPPAENVLSGVTRGYIMEICEKISGKIHETPISTGMLRDFDGLFLTGTSPQVLPISSVDDMKFSSPYNPVITQIRNAYSDMVNQYILQHK